MAEPPLWLSVELQSRDLLGKYSLLQVSPTILLEYQIANDKLKPAMLKIQRLIKKPALLGYEETLFRWVQKEGYYVFPNA